MNIKKRIHWSFLTLVAVFVVNAVITIVLLNNNNKRSEYISKVLDPSEQTLNNFNQMMTESKMYATNWVFLRSKQEDKDALKKIHASDYLQLKSRLDSLVLKWNDKSRNDSLTVVYAGFEALMNTEKEIMTSLGTFTDYDDPVNKFQAERIIEDEVLPETAALMNMLDSIIFFEQGIREKENANLEWNAWILRMLIVLLAVTIIVIGIILSTYLTKIITQPLHQISNIINLLGKGMIKKVSHEANGDEIGEMIISVNNLSDKLLATASFAHEIGVRNFDTYYEPLSKDDTLGKALIAMRDNLKKGEQDLLESNYQKEMLFSNIEEAFFSIDMTTNKLLQMSPACEKIYGYPPAAFLENSNFWYEVIVEEDKSIIQHNYSKMYAGERISHEYRIIRNDKSICWVETKITPTLDKNGKMVRIDGITADVTKRKESEENLKTNIAELKKRNMELDKFVYSVTHDLRAPLRSILGVVEISEDITDDALMLKHFGMIKGSIQRLDGFILDILEYSKNSRLEVMKEEINFKEILNDITGNLKYMGNNNHAVDLKINVSNGVCFKSDKSRIAVILNNLISNAIRYQNPKAEHPYVAIDVDLSEAGAKIGVKDNGIGIRKEQHQKIFEMFYRVSSNSIGSGLGLYLVKETVDKLNGRIEVESEPEKGTTMSIFIPNR